MKLKFYHKFQLNEAVHIEQDGVIYPCVIDEIMFLCIKKGEPIVQYHLWVPVNEKHFRMDNDTILFVSCANKTDEDIIGRERNYVTEIEFLYDLGEKVVVNNFHSMSLNLYEGIIQEIRYMVRSYPPDAFKILMRDFYYKVDVFDFWFKDAHILRTLDDWKNTLVIKNVKA